MDWAVALWACMDAPASDPKDHYPKACPFRFHNFWTKYFHVEHTVKTKWRVTKQGTHMYRFMQKIRTIKTELKPWVKSTFGNIQVKLCINLDKINYIENKLLESPLSFCLNDRMNRMLKQREKLLLFNQKYWE